MFRITRPAEPKDLEILGAIDAECFPPGSNELQPAADGELLRGIQSGLSFVFEIQGEVAGFIQLDLDQESDLELLTLAVREKFRGQGVGGELLNLAKTKARELAKELVCFTAPTNLAMRAALEKSRFSFEAVAKDHYGPGKDRIKYRFR